MASFLCHAVAGAKQFRLERIVRSDDKSEGASAQAAPKQRRNGSRLEAASGWHAEALGAEAATAASLAAAPVAAGRRRDLLLTAFSCERNAKRQNSP